MPQCGWPFRVRCIAVAIWSACALLGVLTRPLLAQQPSDTDTWQPAAPPAIFAGEAWHGAQPILPGDLPLAGALPLAGDLPPIVAANSFHGPEHALVAYQESLPRPEMPAPLPEGAVLEPLPESFALPTPSCLNCGGNGFGCSTCGGCQTCEPCVARTRFGRFACGLYQAICCPDPCYEPRWTGVANAAFWVDGARPVTQVRYRWDASLNLIYPDRAGFIWPTVGTLGPKVAPGSMDLHELSMYNEIASGPSFSFFTNMPYRSYDTDLDGHGAGFGDMDMGTKSVLFDCELLQITFQMRTFIPIGNGLKGIGTMHVSLEPSLIVGLNLAPETYFQAQIAEWIPIGGGGGAGAILHYHTSLNHVLWRWQPSMPIIGTLEANGWSFQDGTYTDPSGVVHSASGETYLSAGPGLRVVVCDKVDFGIGTAFAVTQDHWGEQSVRSEFRWRF
jgi:hypothetical protein